VKEIQRDAVVSKDGVYRYCLTRIWCPRKPLVTFVGLNPSTADATLDDPTVRRCIGFAAAWGGGSLCIVNLFALRSKNPALLRLSRDPVGPENDVWIDRAMKGAGVVIAAWGNVGATSGRATPLLQRHRRRFCYLRLTKQGAPGHPLYVPAATRPTPLA